MLHLFFPRKRKVAPARPRPSVRLGLESLETRDCPATLDPGGPPPPPPPPPPAPMLSLGVTYGDRNSVTLFGQLTNTTTPGGQGIQLGGEVNGMAITDASGNFSDTLPAAGIGNVYAMLINGTSNIAQVTLYDMAPIIDDFGGTEGPGDIWTFTGHVTDRSPAGMVVQFSGQVASLVGKSATVDASGNFSLTIQLNGTETDNGIAEADTTDWYGQQAQWVSCNVYQT